MCPSSNCTVESAVNTYRFDKDKDGIALFVYGRRSITDSFRSGHRRRNLIDWTRLREDQDQDHPISTKRIYSLSLPTDGAQAAAKGKVDPVDVLRRTML
jgi:hypothetical protein